MIDRTQITPATLEKRARDGGFNLPMRALESLLAAPQHQIRGGTISYLHCGDCTLELARYDHSFGAKHEPDNSPDSQGKTSEELSAIMVLSGRLKVTAYENSRVCQAICSDVTINRKGGFLTAGTK